MCFTSIGRENFICLEQLECQGTDQRLCAEVVSFLCQVPLSYSHTRSKERHELTRLRLACQRLNSILKYFCNSLTFRWREKKSELSVIKWPRNQLLNVVAMLWQRLDNVGQRRVTTSETDVATTLIFDHPTMLSRRQPQRCDNVVTTSLCQLGVNLSRKVKKDYFQKHMPHWSSSKNFFEILQTFLY